MSVILVVVKCRQCQRALAAFAEDEDIPDTDLVMIPACPDHREGPRRSFAEWARGRRSRDLSWPDGPTLRADDIRKKLAAARRTRRIRILAV